MLFRKYPQGSKAFGEQLFGVQSSRELINTATTLQTPAQELVGGLRTYWLSPPHYEDRPHSSGVTKSSYCWGRKRISPLSIFSMFRIVIKKKKKVTFYQIILGLSLITAPKQLRTVRSLQP